MFYVFSFPPAVYDGTLNLIASIPGPSSLTFNKKRILLKTKNSNKKENDLSFFTWPYSKLLVSYLHITFTDVAMTVLDHMIMFRAIKNSFFAIFLPQNSRVSRINRTGDNLTDDMTECC